ncbi:NAD(P)H:quinone oxidoreductase [Desulfohalovibrio reitneri]|uniref:NAD(P)H:quinone oxidoreductase n=1 Tax=Desulfohalovibrio reitneri TaxID=1307759 RepID=UPI0004A743EC|nr:NAD(P)H:quinone oxidoreductase [Desulfohalovibrio reitneri]
MKTLVLYYSMYGHIHRMAQEAAEAARSIEGNEVSLARVPEILSGEVIEKMGARQTIDMQQDVPVIDRDEFGDYDCYIFGTPTRFGNMIGQMRMFFDSTGGLWAKGALVGKVGTVFASSNTQHGGQESTILSFHITLLHQGFVITGLPYSFQGQTRVDEVSGCSPYGASTIAGPDGGRTPSENELEGVRFQARHACEIAKKLRG